MSIKSRSSSIRAAKNMPTVHAHAAGIDLGNTQHFVCVPQDSVAEKESPVRSFEVFNPSLDQMVEWLKKCQVTTVAMESTGVMWIPVYQKLEAAGFEVLLVNTKKLKHVPGGKSDVLDCQWIQQLHSYGLLNGSFRPADVVCRLRSLMRQRDNLVRAAGRETQHMQKAMQEMGIHLHVVVADVTGTTGLQIIDAIIAGETDPQALVKLRDPRVRKSTVEEMVAALKGDWRDELLFVLRQSRQAYQFYQGQMEELDQKIVATLALVPTTAVPVKDESVTATPENQSEGASTSEAKPKKPKRQSGGNSLQHELRPQLTRIFGVDLTQIPGLNILGILILLAEVGNDLKKFRNGDAFAAWLGLCPGAKISGGKVISSRTPRVVSRLAMVLRLAAIAIGRTDTCLGHFYRRMKGRHGPPKAITATARKLAVLLHKLIAEGTSYREPDAEKYQAKIDAERVKRLLRQAKDLGYELVRIEPIPEPSTA